MLTLGRLSLQTKESREIAAATKALISSRESAVALGIPQALDV